MQTRRWRWLGRLWLIYCVLVAGSGCLETDTSDSEGEGTAVEVMGEFCANDSIQPFDLRVTVNVNREDSFVTLTDPIIPIDAECEVELLPESSRLVGNCTDPIAPCDACGIAIDLVDEDRIFVDYTMGCQGSRSVLASRCP